MWEYFQFYYINQNMGPGWIVTEIFNSLALVFLLYKGKWDKKGCLKNAAAMFLVWLADTVFSAMLYLAVGHNRWTDRGIYLLVMFVYAACFSKYRISTRVVRCFTFFSCMMQIITISEPIGEWMEDINAGWTWSEHLTWVTVVVLETLTLIFIQKFDTDDLTFIPHSQIVLTVAVSFLGIVMQSVTLGTDEGRRYMILAAGCMWVLILMAYYIFYHVSREYNWKLSALAEHHKEELSQEMLQYSAQNFEEMHEIRHEVKNHLAYIRALNENKEYDKLTEYLGQITKETEKMFSFVECGNSIANAVMNHAIYTAREKNIRVEPLIIMPPELPYQDTDFCSLLSNLMDNAIEAASQSGAADPVINVTIRPQQDYLFIRVTNPVNHEISYHRRLTLSTTKNDKQAHGYGTKIIRRIAEKYHGTFNYAIKEGMFVADVMVSLEN